MTSRVVAFSRAGGRVKCDILVAEDSAGFERIGGILERELGAQIIERVDGFESRRWVLRKGGVDFELHHDDAWGNQLVSVSPDGDAVVTELGKQLAGKLVPGATAAVTAVTKPNKKLDGISKALAKHALEQLNDPNAEARIDAWEQRRGRHGELVIEGSRAGKKAPSARNVELAGIGELASYLSTRGGRLDGDAVAFVAKRAEGDCALRVEWGSAAVVVAAGQDQRTVSLTDAGSLDSAAFERAVDELVAAS